MYEFSPETLKVLQRNGWTPDRRVDISAYKAYFAQTNQPTSDIIFDFLTSFGGLKFTFPSRLNPSKDFEYIFEIDPIDSGEDISLEWLDWYVKEWVQKPLCIVGRHDNIDTLAMTPDGEFYCCFDSWVFKRGNSVVESIESIVTHTGGEQIHQKSKMVDDVKVNVHSEMWTTKKEEYALQEVAPGRYAIVRLPNMNVTIEDNDVYEAVKSIMLREGNTILPPLYKPD